MTDSIRGFKLVTSEYRPPIQGGNPIWDGTPGVVLPKVRLDTGTDTCSYGWNFCLRPETAARIGGFWSDGRPSVLLEVETIGRYVERGDKCRAEQLRILGVCEDEVWVDALRIISEAFEPHSDQMLQSQLGWRRALGRPRRNVRDVERGLKAALAQRGLDWRLRQFESARDAWAARDGRAARAAWAAWAARDGRDARAAWAAWATWDAWAARAARAAWAGRDGRDAWAAWAALTVEFASLNKWVKHDPLLLTTGLRDAYEAGLEIAIPTGPGVLGWAIREK